PVRCTTSDASGNTSSFLFTVKVIAPVLAITAEPPSMTNQAGSTATFNVTASGIAPFTYQWRQNSNPLTEGTNSSLSLPNVQPANAGIYTVVVIDRCGSSVTSLLAVLAVNRPPLARSDGFGTPRNMARILSKGALLVNDS